MGGQAAPASSRPVRAIAMPGSLDQGPVVARGATHAPGFGRVLRHATPGGKGHHRIHGPGFGRSVSELGHRQASLSRSPAAAGIRSLQAPLTGQATGCRSLRMMTDATGSASKRSGDAHRRQVAGAITGNPWRDSGEAITPAERMRLPLTSTAPSCRGVSAAKQVQQQVPRRRAAAFSSSMPG